MIVLIDGVKYRLMRPESEAWLERRIEENYQHIFGDEAHYFPKKKIRSKAGIGTIPDAFAIYFDRVAKWAVIEVELASHPVYHHVFPQLAKFGRALEDGASRRKIVDFFYETVKGDGVLEARMKKQIGSGEVYKFLADLVAEPPTIVVIIDERSDELDEALKGVGGEVRVIEFKTYRREGISDDVNAYCFEPVVAAGKGVEQGARAAVVAVEAGGAPVGDDRAGRGACGEAAYIERFRQQLNNPNTLASKILKCVRRRGSVDKDEMRRICVEEFGCKSRTSGSINACFKVLEQDGYIRMEGRGQGSRLVAL